MAARDDVKQDGRPDNPAPPRNGLAQGGGASHEQDPSHAAEGLWRVIDSLPAMIGYWDAAQCNVVANRAYESFFGVLPGAIHGRHISELLGQELYARNRPYIERALAGEPQLFDRTIIDPSGNPRYTQASYIPDIVDGQVKGFAVLVTDITARRIAERARAAAEARFGLAFERSPVGMGLLAQTHELIEVNRSLCELLGYSEEELRGRSFADLIEPAARDEERARISALFTEQQTNTTERRLLRKDGTSVWAIVSLALAQNEEVLGIAHIQDITARKEIEEDLRSSRARLTEAEQVARMGSFEWDIHGDRIMWSEGLLQIHGLTRATFQPTLDSGVEQRVFPDDRSFVRETVERAIAERGTFTIEYRALRSDGRVRTLRSRGEVVCDPRGEPVRLVGVAQDITDARLAQEALRTTSADLERRALELQKLALRTAPERRVQPQAPLTPRQLEILRLIAQGKTSAAIAKELVVSEGTVKWHVKQILAKTASSSRAEAVARVLGSEP